MLLGERLDVRDVRDQQIIQGNKNLNSLRLRRVKQVMVNWFMCYDVGFKGLYAVQDNAGGFGGPEKAAGAGNLSEGKSYECGFG